MNPRISASVDAMMRKTYELESDKTWAKITEGLWVRPYFNATNTEIWIVTVTILKEQIKLGVFKQHGAYSFE